MFTGILYRRRNGAVYWLFSFYGLEKRKGMGFAADVSRLSKGILNERLQVLISCVARCLVVNTAATSYKLSPEADVFVNTLAIVIDGV